MKSQKLKTKSSSKRRERSWSVSDDERSKKPRSQPKAKDHSAKTKGVKKNVKEAVKDPKPQRKSRWQETDHKATPIDIPISPQSDPLPRIKDHLHDKKKIVDLLFQIVPGETLQKLIPDYLQKKSIEELKNLCLEQINLLTDEVILEVIAGKSVNTKEVETARKGENVKVEEQNKVSAQEEGKTSEKKETVEGENIGAAPLGKESKTSVTVERKTAKTSNPAPDNASGDTLELHTTATDMASVLYEENQIPVVIKDEVAKALITPERDAELLELEMRARAIRSLLKARSQATEDDDGGENDA